MSRIKAVLLVSALAFLSGPVLADELGDQYRATKNGGEDPPQWLVDDLFGPNEADGSRSLGGDDFEDAALIPFVPCGSYTDTGNTNNYGRDFDTNEDPEGCYEESDYSDNCFAGKDVLYTFTLPGEFTVSASVCGNTSYDSVLGILDEDHELVAMNDDYEGCSGYSSFIEACCLEAGTYFLVVDGYGHSAKGTYSLEVNFGCAPCGDEDDEDDDDEATACDSLQVLDVNLPFHGILSTSGAPNVYGSSAGDVAVRFTLDGNTAIDLQTCFAGTTFDVDSYWFANAAPCDSGAFLGYNDGDQGCNWATHVAYDCGAPLPAGTYVVLLSGWECQSGNVELNLGATACAPVGTEDEPRVMTLRQNAPNPFNPVTTIAFEMQELDQARLTVHDLSGREVAVLVDGMMESGPHRVSFDGSRLTSGVYFYTLQTSRQVATRKMILTK